MGGNLRPRWPGHTFAPVVGIIFNSVLFTLSVLVSVRHRCPGCEDRERITAAPPDAPNIMLPRVLHVARCATAVRSHRVLELHWGGALYRFRS